MPPALSPTMDSAGAMAFHTLSIMAVVFSTLSALFGIYIVLFVLALWSTYRSQQGVAQTRLRIVTIALFLCLITHYMARALTFARARNMNTPSDEETKWTVPLVFVGALTSTIAGFLSDGLVAWRCYVIYGRTRSAFYLSVTAVVINGLLGLAGDFQQLTIYRSVDLYNNRFSMIALQVNAAWGWCIFGINTLLTGSILGKIIFISRGTASSPAQSVPSIRYCVIVEAIVESAMVTWVGLLLYEISTFAPTGGVTLNLDIGYVMVCIVPIFFGISQCLITARLGFAGDHPTIVGPSASYCNNPSGSSKESIGGMMVFRKPPTSFGHITTTQSHRFTLDEAQLRRTSSSLEEEPCAV